MASATASLGEDHRLRRPRGRGRVPRRSGWLEGQATSVVDFHATDAVAVDRVVGLGDNPTTSRRRGLDHDELSSGPASRIPSSRWARRWRTPPRRCPRRPCVEPGRRSSGRSSRRSSPHGGCGRRGRPPPLTPARVTGCARSSRYATNTGDRGLVDKTNIIVFRSRRVLLDAPHEGMSMRLHTSSTSDFVDLSPYMASRLPVHRHPPPVVMPPFSRTPPSATFRTELSRFRLPGASTPPVRVSW